MAKTLTGTPMFELKATDPKKLPPLDVGKVTKAISDDLVAFVGKPMQGLVVKGAEGKKLYDKMLNSDLPNQKVNVPLVRVGICGKDVILLLTDAVNGGKYEESVVLVAGYVPLREKLKKQAGAVVNLDPGDKVIDKAASDMAANNNTTATNAKDAELGLIIGTAPIVLVAHGDEDRNSRGQLYGKDFAGRKPEELIKLLTANRDPAKRLHKDYAGIVYLDGCFTAQGSAMENYTKQVWDGLRKAGFAKLSVKGNLGLAATTSSGDEIISTTEAKAQAKKLNDQADEAWKKATVKHNAKLDEIWDQDYRRTGGDQDAFKKDSRVLKVAADAEKTKEKLRANLTKELQKIPGYRVPNLVGQFGLTRLN